MNLNCFVRLQSICAVYQSTNSKNLCFCSHEELLKLNGVYSGMWSQQLADLGECSNFNEKIGSGDAEEKSKGDERKSK